MNTIKNSDKYIVVDKTKIDQTTGKLVHLFALCASEPDQIAHNYSLTFEGYVSKWVKNRADLDAVGGWVVVPFYCDNEDARAALEKASTAISAAQTARTDK